MNNVINILNIQGLGIKSVNLYDYKEPLLYPDSLLKIIITNYPYVFRNIIKSYGFNVDSWPTDLSFSVEDKSNSLLTIICPTVAQGGKKVNKLLKETVAKNKGLILIIRKDSDEKSFTPQIINNSIVNVSMVAFAKDVLQGLDKCEIPVPKKNNIQKLCESWIVLGEFPKNLDFNKTIEQQDIVQFPFPWMVVTKFTGTVYDLVQKRLQQLIVEKLTPEIKSGNMIWVKDKFFHKDMIRHSEPLACDASIQYGLEMGKPFWNVMLWKNNEDFKIFYRLFYKVALTSYATIRTEILTSKRRIINRLEEILKEWIFEPSFYEHFETSINIDKDVSKLTINQTLESMVDDIYNVVTGKTKY